MKIALDYDHTFTLDPQAWLDFVRLMKGRGHDVRIVTARSNRFDRTAALVAVEEVLPVIYTNGAAKEWYCQHFTDGWFPDVWIDDKVRNILNNSTTLPADLYHWRATRNEGPSFDATQEPGVVHEFHLTEGA